MFLKNYRKRAKRLPWGSQKFTKIEPPLLFLDVKLKSQRVQAGSTRADLETRQWLTWTLLQALTVFLSGGPSIPGPKCPAPLAAGPARAGWNNLKPVSHGG